MKISTALISTFIYTACTLAFAQSDFTGGDDARRLGPEFESQRQSLINSFMNSRERETIIGSNSPTKQEGDQLEFSGLKVDENQSEKPMIDMLDSRQVNSAQLTPNATGPNYKIDVPDTTKKQTAPLRLYFDQIQLESSEVSEVTLKDGTVVTTEELQEFAKEVILKKLNEQK